MRMSDWSSDVCSSDLRTPRITAELVGSEFGGKLPEMKKRFRRRHFGQIRQIEQINHKAPRRVELLARGTQLGKMCSKLFAVILLRAEHPAEIHGAGHIGIPIADRKSTRLNYSQ